MVGSICPLYECIKGMTAALLVAHREKGNKPETEAKTIKGSSQVKKLVRFDDVIGQEGTQIDSGRTSSPLSLVSGCR